MNNIMKYICTQ